jgi:4-amino-4-deoxy-L-arabinose transferase-like glycosyltransferase
MQPMNATLKQRLTSMPPLVWLLLLTAACLVPFAGKAFFIDDTLFLRAAGQIQKHPLDFYGFSMNWFGYTTPMTVAFDNPPLTSYYIAFVAFLLGWSEWALHLAFLVPALAAVAGIFALAKSYSGRPFTAALFAVLTPVFLISATAVMSDVTELAFWVWTLVLFEKGLRTESRAAFVTSGILAGLTVLTKYPGLSLVPLLLAYGFCAKQRPGWWLVALVVPLLFAAGYQWLTHHLYGHGLILGAAHEASKFRANAHVAPWEQVLIGASFVGACFLPILLYTPWLWTRRMILLMPCLAAAGLLFIPRMAVYAPLIWNAAGSLNWGMFLYLAILMVTGLYVFLLAGMDVWERRDAVSVLLLSWLLGVFVFTVAVNWTINGRSLLPAVPAIGILAARRLERKLPDSGPNLFLPLALPALVAGAVSLLLVNADYDTANSQRAAALQLGARYRAPGKTTWYRFSNHWGFQYYIEMFGARAVEEKSPAYSPGDILIVASNIQDFDPADFDATHAKQLRLIETGEVVGNRHLSTSDANAEAGFYGTCIGVLPFAIGDIGSQNFEVFEIINAAGHPPLKKNAS